MSPLNVSRCLANAVNGSDSSLNSLVLVLLSISSHPFNILNTSIRSPLYLLVSNGVNPHFSRRLS